MLLSLRIGVGLLATVRRATAMSVMAACMEDIN